MDFFIPPEYLPLIFLLLGLVIVFFIVREIRLMWSGTRRLELELEKEKLEILKQDASARGTPFSRISPDQLASLRAVDEENQNLTTEIFFRHNLVDRRITRLENILKQNKLNRMLEKIHREEERLER